MGAVEQGNDVDGSGENSREGTSARENGDSGLEVNTSDAQTTSSAKVYDPESCKKKRKFSSAQMQEKEIQMKEDRQTVFMETMRSINNNTSQEKDDNGDYDFGRMVGKQMRLVCVLF